MVVTRLLRRLRPPQPIRVSQAQQATEAGRLHLLFPRPANIVMFGDSLTHWGHWQGLFGRADVLNQGIHGERTNWAVNRIPGVLASNPRIVFTMFGLNDVLAGYPVAVTLEGHEAITRQLVAAGVAVKVQSVLLTAFADENRRIDAINAGLRALAADCGADEYIDLNAVLAPGGRPLHVCDDGRHMTAAGYRAWTDAILPTLPND